MSSCLVYLGGVEQHVEKQSVRRKQRRNRQTSMAMKETAPVQGKGASCGHVEVVSQPLSSEVSAVDSDGFELVTSKRKR